MVSSETEIALLKQTVESLEHRLEAAETKIVYLQSKLLQAGGGFAVLVAIGGLIGWAASLLEKIRVAGKG